LPTPEETNAIPFDRIKEYIGTDAALYVPPDNWGVLSSNTVVRGSVKLVSTHTGKTLWGAPINGVLNSDNSGGGILGALVNAVATQIIGSINDNTPKAARIANKQAFDSKKRGLLPGPYYLTKKQ